MDSAHPIIENPSPKSVYSALLTSFSACRRGHKRQPVEQLVETNAQMLGEMRRSATALERAATAAELQAAAAVRAAASLERMERRAGPPPLDPAPLRT